MDKNFQIQSKSILAVEGKDECQFFEALLRHLKTGRIQIIDIGGKDKFKAEFTAFTNLEGFENVERIGFVRDAENIQVKAAFDSISDILKICELPQPIHPNSIASVKLPYTGIFIMPDNDGCGMLEDLCLRTISSHPVKSCIDNFLECFSRHQDPQEATKFNRQKACVQAYLATRSPIINNLGLGALKGYWNFDDPCFDDLKLFLKSLFN